jgi:hypothetical protein
MYVLKLRSRIPGIFTGPPPKVERMLLAAYRAVSSLHQITRSALAKGERKKTALSKDRSNVLDLVRPTDGFSLCYANIMTITADARL